MSLTLQTPWFVDCIVAASKGAHAEVTTRVAEFPTASHYLLAVLLLGVAALRAAGQAVTVR